MVELHTGSTDALSPLLLRDLRPLLECAFDGAFGDDDSHHTLGGVHVWVTGSAGLISHGSFIDRTLVCSGETLRVGYVEAVATEESYRRQGHGARVIRRTGQLIRARYPLAVLSTETHAFYKTLGWERCRGPTFVNGATAEHAPRRMTAMS